jgi:hypothetical protein
MLPCLSTWRLPTCCLPTCCLPNCHMPNCSLCFLTGCLVPVALMDADRAPYWSCLQFALPTTLLYTADRWLPAFLRYFIPVCFPLSRAMPCLALFVHGYQCLLLHCTNCTNLHRSFAEVQRKSPSKVAQPRVEQGTTLQQRITLTNPCTFNVSPFRIQIFQLIQLLPSNSFQNPAVFLPG